MIASRITPKIIFYGLALNLSLWLLAHFLYKLGWKPPLLISAYAIHTYFSFWAFLFAFLLNLEIAGEYRDARWLRISWLALAGNAGISVIRYVIESKLLDLIWEGYRDGYIFGLIQHSVIVPANVCLMVGLLAMGWSYHKVGLGFRIEKRDYAFITGLLLLTVSIFAFREGLTQAKSPYSAGKYLQLINIGQLALSAAASIVLHRIAVQMDGGKLAIALRMLSFYTLLRVVLVLGETLVDLGIPAPDGHGKYITALVISLGWQSVPWVVALAAAYHAEMTVEAAEELKQMRAANAELARCTN
jgi:hypothetical protein